MENCANVGSSQQKQSQIEEKLKTIVPQDEIKFVIVLYAVVMRIDCLRTSCPFLYNAIRIKLKTKKLQKIKEIVDGSSKYSLNPRNLKKFELQQNFLYRNPWPQFCSL